MLEVIFFNALAIAPLLSFDVLVPEATQVLTALRVALLTPAVRVVLSKFVLLALIELALKLHLAAGDLGLLVPVLGLGLLIPVLVVVVPIGVLPFAPLVTVVVRVVVVVLLVIIVVVLTVIPVILIVVVVRVIVLPTMASAHIPKHVEVAVLLPQLFIVPHGVISDCGPFLVLLKSGGLLLSAVVVPFIDSVIATHLARNDWLSLTPVVDNLHLPSDTGPIISEIVTVHVKVFIITVISFILVHHMVVIFVVLSRPAGTLFPEHEVVAVLVPHFFVFFPLLGIAQSTPVLILVWSGGLVLYAVLVPRSART